MSTSYLLSICISVCCVCNFSVIRCIIFRFYSFSYACLVKPVLSGHLKIDKCKALMDDGSLIKVESIEEGSPWNILQYFLPALSDNQYEKTIFAVKFE